jgi:hypothetical protein
MLVVLLLLLLLLLDEHSRRRKACGACMGSCCILFPLHMLPLLFET